MNTPPPRALVIDDEGLVSIMIEDILTRRGYAVTVVNRRNHLEQIVHVDGWSLVVSDTDLATYEEMTTWNARKIVLCSCRTHADLTEAFPGMSYITKPCLEDDFDRVLGERHDR